MSGNDRAKWDQKWLRRLEPAAPNALLQAFEAALPGGIAIDVACGLGQNAVWLAHRGYKVLGLDISRVALERAWRQVRNEALRRRLLFVQGDLDRWRLPPRCVDLICVFRFLNRDLIPVLQEALRGGGYLFYQTRHAGILRRLPQATPEYLLQRGELVRTFSTWHVLRYDEGPEDARLVARKPADCFT